MNKLQIVSVILLVILIGAFSNWMLTSMDTSPRIIPRESRHEPDYFLKNFTATSMNREGAAQHRLQAEYLEHYPDDDSVELTRLTLDLYRRDLPPWTARAEQGVVYERGERIELSGNVRLHRPATAEGEALTLLTEALTVYPQREYAETDAAVTITGERSDTRAVGMRLDVGQGLLELLSKTRGTYVIPPR
jgi:lipopolysaccharide export system protein LptC